MKSNCVNILYQCDDKYAPFMGVSLTSLLINNSHIDKMRIFILASGISDENKIKVHETCEKYGREIVFMECEYLDELLAGIGVHKYRDSYATFYKLFVADFFSQEGIEVERLLYIDSDTIIEGNIEPFYYYDLKGMPLGMIPDTFAFQYKLDLGFDVNDIYYNAGIILYDYINVKNNGWEEKMRKHMLDVKSDYEKHDQDLINIVYKNNITTIPLRYNMFTLCKAVPVNAYCKVHKKVTDYSEEELKIERENAVILHCLRFNGEYPWMKNSKHPYTENYKKYKKVSAWKETSDIKRNNNILFVMERILFRIIPKTWYLHLLIIGFRPSILKYKKVTGVE